MSWFSATEKFISEDLFCSVLPQFKKYHPSGNLRFNYSGIFQSLKLRISIEKIFSISKVNSTPYILAGYGLMNIDSFHALSLYSLFFHSKRSKVVILGHESVIHRGQRRTLQRKVISTFGDNITFGSRWPPYCWPPTGRHSLHQFAQRQTLLPKLLLLRTTTLPEVSFEERELPFPFRQRVSQPIRQSCTTWLHRWKSLLLSLFYIEYDVTTNISCILIVFKANKDLSIKISHQTLLITQLLIDINS